MDTPMSESRSVGTQTKRQRTDAEEGASEVGQGHLITIPRSIPHGFNNTYTVRLTYADAYYTDINCNGGSGSRLYSLTSIYDPDTSGAGHQPLMRDLWASQYDYYAVLATRVKIVFFNANYDTITYTSAGTSSQRVGSVAVTLLPTTNAFDASSAATGYMFPALEMKNGTSHVLRPETEWVYENSFTPGDWLIDAKDQDSDNTWTAVGSNPGVPRYLALILNSTNASALSGASEVPYARIEYTLTIDYDVQFTQLNQSLRSAAS